MSETINILGDTPKEQWKNAIGIFDMAISSNINAMRKDINELFDMTSIAHEYSDEDVEETWAHANNCADSALKVLDDFVSEMKRLVEGAM